MNGTRDRGRHRLQLRDPTDRGESREGPSRRRPRLRLTAPLVALVLTSCNDEIAPILPVATTIVLDVSFVELTSVGDTASLTATVRDQNGAAITPATVSWVSLAPAVATVSNAGVVTAIANGAAEIQVTSGGASTSAAITVIQAPDSVAVSADSIGFDALGDTTRLVTTVLDPGGTPITGAGLSWASSDSMVATVSSGGLVTSVGDGTAVITADAMGAFVPVAVTVAQVATSVALQPDSIVFSDVSQTTPVAVTVFDRLGTAVAAPSVVWSTADSSIATVDSTGAVTSIGTGTVSISADVGGVADSIDARVEPELTVLLASPDTVSAEVAASVALSARVEDLLGSAYAGATVTWAVTGGGGAITSAAQSVSDPSGHAAATWELGTVAGPQHATASVDTRGSTVTITFVANAVAAAPVTATLVADSVLLSGTGETVFLGPTYTDTYGNTALPGAITWTSTNPAAATVSPAGLVTAVANGTTYVRAEIGVPTDSILVTVQQRGAITVTFDDGWLTAYTNAVPVMRSYNLVGNVGVYTAPIDGGWSGYMTLANLQELYAEGWGMVSHTVSHDSLTTLSDPVLDWELRTSQQWLRNQGFDTGDHIFIVPYHDYGLRERIAASGYYTATRGVSANIVVPDSMVHWQPSNPFELTGIDADQLPYTTVAGRDQLRVMLQRTLDEGRFLDVLFHQVPAANVADFDATMAVINDFRDRVLPYHELYPKFARPVF